MPWVEDPGRFCLDNVLFVAARQERTKERRWCRRWQRVQEGRK